MQVDVSFPSPTRIRACSKDLAVEIGPPPDRGGDPAAYGPFDLLLCSLATCTGFQVLDFLQQRGFDTASAGVRIEAERGEESHLLESISIEIRVPEGFPGKYNDAIVRAAGLCFIKQQLGHRPGITTTVTATAPAPGSESVARER
jgi:ribosomal protein S12 methylthiotransferase accessory factor